MLATASMKAVCAIPPVRRASHSANSLATGMKVGIGRSASCSVCSRAPRRVAFAFSAIALSSVCMTRTMIVRRDQPRGSSSLMKVSGWRAAAPSSLSGRVTRVPSPTSTVYSALIESAASP
jgi:hypothetical protein